MAAAKKKKEREKMSSATGYPPMAEGVTNVGARVEDGVLYLAIKLSEDHGETAKGFRRIGTTHGNKPIPGNPTIQIGLFVYDKAKD